MAVQAKRGVKDSVLIEKTRVILDSLTPQVLESEFPRVLERIQERRELIQVLGELDPKLIAELRQEDVEEDGSREYLQDDAELRTSFGIDVIDGRIVNVTTAPFLIVKLRVNLRNRLYGVDRSVAHYYIGDISREVMLETLVDHIKDSAEYQLRKASTLSFESKELGWDGIAPAAISDQDLAKLIADDPLLLDQNSIAEWDQLRPGWIKALELYLIKHLDFKRDYDPNTSYSKMLIRRVVQDVSDRLSPEALAAYHRNLFWHAVRKDASLLEEIPDHIRVEESNDACETVFRRDFELIVGLSQVGEYQWTKGQPKAYEADIDYNIPDGYGAATREASKEFSRLRFSPDQLDRLQKHDRVHFVVGSWYTPDLLNGIDKVASAELRDHLKALRYIMPAGSMSPINWFKIMAHTGYTASITLHVPVDADAHMGDEFKLAVEAAVEHNLAYVRDNWDRIRVATGFYLAFDKGRFEDFSSRVTVKVTPATVNGTAITIATEPLIKDVP